MADEQEEKQEIQKRDPNKNYDLLAGEQNSLYNPAKFDQLYRVANLFSKTTLIPPQFQNKPNDCFIALNMASRMDIDPMMLMQNMYVIHGRPGIEAKLTIGLINSKGPFKGPVQWKFEGEGVNRKCTAFATHSKTNEVCAVTVSWEMAEKEGWTKKEGSKWKTMPDLMFRYRSATFLARLYCPEVTFGLMTTEELEDIEKESQDFGPDKDRVKAEVEAKTGQPVIDQKPTTKADKVLGKIKPKDTEPAKAETFDTGAMADAVFEKLFDSAVEKELVLEPEKVKLAVVQIYKQHGFTGILDFIENILKDGIEKVCA